MLASDLSRVPSEGAEARQNLRAAEASGDVHALIEALHAMQMVAAGPRNVARRLEIADRVERLCHDADLEDDLAWPLGWRVDAFFQLGQRPALDNAIARLEEYADRRRDALATWRGTMARAALAEHEGRFDEAVRFGTEALELAARGNHQAVDFAYRFLVSICRLKTSGRTLARWHRGGGAPVYRRWSLFFWRPGRGRALPWHCRDRRGQRERSQVRPMWRSLAAWALTADARGDLRGARAVRR